MIYNKLNMEKGYLNYLNNLDAEASGLLGFFDSDNEYIIEQNIKDELILCNKLIESYSGDKITASAKIGESKFNFTIYIQDGQNNKKRAGLFILEKSTMGFVEKDLQTYVDSIVLENDSSFFVELKKHFHLYTIDESEGIDINNSALKLIAERLAKLKSKYNGILLASADLDRQYVMKMLSLIKTSGVYGPKLLMELKKQIDAKKLSKSSPKYWRELKVMIDLMLIKNMAVFDGPIQDKIGLLQRNYINALKNVKEPVIIETAPAGKKKKKDDKKDKKKDDKKKGGGKDSGKDKGKSKGGNDKGASKDAKPGTTKINKKNPIKAKTRKPPETEVELADSEDSFLGKNIHNKVSKRNKGKVQGDIKRRKLVDRIDDRGLER